LTLLSLRALNRATLARQLLLERSPMSALDAIEHLVGMQAQAPFAPYYGLWSRLDGFTGDELSGLLTDRKAVRLVLMRGTIHLVTAEDCHRLRPLVQPMLSHADRTRVISDEHRKKLFSGKNGVFPGTVLVDGFVAGTWELVGTGKATRVRVTPYERLGDEVLGEITAEGNRLLDRAFDVADPVVDVAPQPRSAPFGADTRL
jgi:Winged helix DNA-binding domain